MTKEPFIVHSEITNEIYVVCGTEKCPVTEQVIKAMQNTGRLEQPTSDDCVSRAEVKRIAKEMYLEVANMDLDVHTISDCTSYTSSKCRQVLEDKLQALPPVTPTQSKCEWFMYDYRAITPKEHSAPNPYWRIPEKYRTELKYCPYCGNEIDYSEIDAEIEKRGSENENN